MCGLFGFLDYGHKISTAQINNLIDALATESAVRGTDACGIAYNIDSKLETEKEPKSAYEVTFKLPKDTAAVIGHTRHSTQGSSKKWFNNHPFKGRLNNGSMFALAHNGILVNDKTLRKKHVLPETRIETDSYIAVQLLEREEKLSVESIKGMIELLTGSFSFSILDDQNNIYLVKGDSPLSILHFTELKLFAFASTEQILWRALSSSLLPELKSGRYEEVRIGEGQILMISADGRLTRGEFEYLPEYSGQYNWWDYETMYQSAFSWQDDYYIAELKSIAGAFGFLPENIDHMLRCGYSLEEIEGMLYGDEFEYALMEK